MLENFGMCRRQKEPYPFVVEQSGLLCGHRTLVAAQGEFVLRLACDVELLGENLRGFAHVETTDRIRKPRK